MTAAVNKSLALISMLFLCFATAGCGGSDQTSSPVSITTQLLVSGLNTPLDLEQPNDSTGRLFAVEQGGTIRVIQNGAVLPQAFLDITSEVIKQDEMELLGMAFHPNYQQNGKFYVNLRPQQRRAVSIGDYRVHCLPCESEPD